MRSTIGLFRALLLTLLFALSAPARAGDYVDAAALDELFAQLRTAPSAAEADDIARQIWDYWLHPDEPELARRMSSASLLLGAGDLQASLRLLDGIVADYPSYAEGWNQRATVEYMLGRLEPSLADIAQVLALEPRHFGALSGRVLIYLKQGRHEAALEDMLAALAIHPYLSEKRLFPELAEDVTHV